MLPLDEARCPGLLWQFRPFRLVEMCRGCARRDVPVDPRLSAQVEWIEPPAEATEEGWRCEMRIEAAND